MKTDKLRRALCLVVVAAAALDARRARAENDTPFPCEGRWQGLGRNTGFDSSWTIDMVVHAPDASGSCGTIEYTNPACGGVMIQCAGSSTLKVREKYTHGQAQCAPPGDLVFSCDGDRMTWEWHGWEVVHSTLQRVGPPPAPAGQPPGGGDLPAPAAGSAPGGGSTPPSGAPPPASTPAEAPRSTGRCGCEVVGARGARAGAAWWLAPLAALGLGRRRRRR